MFKDSEEILAVIEEFKRFVIEEARNNLRKPDSRGYIKDTTGKLANSIVGETKVSKNSIRLSFDMLATGTDGKKYGWFQDKGVSGKNKKYDPPFSYGDKMPPPRAFDKWVVRKGIAPRDEKGRFKGRSISSVGFQKSITFLIARSVFYNGIKPSMFFTKPFKKHFATLGKELQEKYGLTIVKLYEDMINESLKPNEYIKIKKL